MFAEAQMKLQTTFGMEMRALPGKENVSVKDRRGMFVQLHMEQEGGCVLGRGRQLS